MTYKISSELAALIHSLFTPAKLFAVAEIGDDPPLLPETAGVYAWWFDRDLNVGLDEMVVKSGCWSLLYVGIAPRRLTANGRWSGSTLRRRLKCHYAGRCAGSTLRRTLATLLAVELNLAPALTASKKLRLLGDGEHALSAWISRHARLSWIEHGTPRNVEEAILRTSPPPLNVAGVGNGRSSALQTARKHFLQAARESPRTL